VSLTMELELPSVVGRSSSCFAVFFSVLKRHVSVHDSPSSSLESIRNSDVGFPCPFEPKPTGIVR
jgi:hypothetical protein